MLLSFIVPAYNAEKYLSTCLDSLLKQNISHNDYEIIIVNDGSIDGTLKIASEYQEQFSLIKIINQQNQGLSSARNEGFLRAEGEFIWFVDSDDYISVNCLQELINFCHTTQCDLFGIAPSFPFREIFPETLSIQQEVSKEYSGKEWLLSPNVFIGAWAYVIRRNFWKEKKLSFFPSIYYEDTECMSRAIYYADKIFVLNEFSVYNYVQHPGSIMNSKVSRKKIFDVLIVSASLRKFASDVKDPVVQLYFEKIYTNCFISGFNMIIDGKMDISVAKEFILRAKDCYPEHLFGKNIMQKIYQYLVIHYPLFYFRLKKILK